MNGSFIRTTLFLTVLTVVLVLIGKTIAGTQGMIWAFVLAFIMNFGSYWFSDKVALAMSGAHAVSPAEAPELYRIGDQVAQEAGVPRPRVYVIESDSPNAFATGRDPEHAAVAVTTGLWRRLDKEEIEKHTRYCVRLFLHGLLHLSPEAAARGKVTGRQEARKQTAPATQVDTPDAYDAGELAAVQEENRRLKLLLAESMLEVARLKDPSRPRPS